MKRKFFWILAIFLMVAAGTVKAQSYKQWHENYGYDKASNLWWRAGAVYSNQLFTNKADNVGLDVGILKRSGNWITLRELIQINGFKCTGVFDRYGKIMTGAQIDFTQNFYLYGDIGAVYNKGLGDDPFGIALDAGLGAKIYLSEYTALFFEVGTDRVQNRNTWTSTPSATGGILVGSGLTDNDKYNIQILDNQPKMIEELSLQAKAAEEQVRVYSKTLDTMNQTLVAANNMIGKLRKEIIKHEEEEDKNCIKAGDFPDIYFGFGKSTLNEFEYDKLISIADMMSMTDDYYAIYGYCSNDGQDDTNYELAQRRIWKVIDVLSKLGVDETRFIEVVPIGKAITYGDGEGTINRFVRIVKK